MEKPSFLISHRGALGDFVLTLPQWVSLKIHFSNHKFIGLGKPSHMELAEYLGIIDQVENSESQKWLKFYEGQEIPEEFGKIGVALFYGSEAKPLENSLKATGTEDVLFQNIRPPENLHIIDYHNKILSQLNVSTPEICADFIPPTPKAEVKTLIHPGAGSESKRFNAQFYLFLANELKNLGLPDIHILLGPQETSLENHFISHYPILKPKNLLECYQFLSGTCLYIGNDSGVSHLSALIGNPTIGLYKSTSPKNWGLRGSQVASVEASDEAIAMAKIQKILPQFTVHKTGLL